MSRDAERALKLKAQKSALGYIVTAIDLLDAHQGPPEVTASLELARQMLRDYLRGAALRD
jgi:hypothetical protein